MSTWAIYGYTIRTEYVRSDELWRYYIYLDSNGQLLEKSEARYIDDLDARHAAKKCTRAIEARQRRYVAPI